MWNKWARVFSGNASRLSVIVRRMLLVRGGEICVDHSCQLRCCSVPARHHTLCRRYRQQTAVAVLRSSSPIPACVITASCSTVSSTMGDQPELGVEGELSVQHDAASHEFYIILGQDKAVLQYEETGDGKVDLYHTLVPPAFRGKGVAKLLAQAALDHFVSKSTPMVLTCTYLQKYVKDKPQSHHLQYIVDS